MCLQTISVWDGPNIVCRLFLFGTVHTVSADYFCLEQSTLCLQTISVWNSPRCVCRLF
ncbi:hypothetical protein DPMN_066970 [Dreissena polymorpha]|uniref:Uncharacterized protein n=1 Tax=Dreissena polymorpha TaxID=45954 RepID=A0A9D3YYW5_DREPO|nr:hypothetical protein DPMN_066970 [Dreissena polymorpha]